MLQNKKQHQSMKIQIKTKNNQISKIKEHYYYTYKCHG
jgi:hypothetical protein